MSDFALALEYFRGEQADQFTQEATVQRPVGEPTTNTTTGAVTQAVTTIYTGRPCKITASDREGSDIQTGETEIRLADGLCKFPVGSDIQINDLVTITASVYDDIDVGRRYRVTDVDRREWQISRRCVIEEYTVPALHGVS